MNYVYGRVRDDEHIEYVGKAHWSVILWPFVMVLGLIPAEGIVPRLAATSLVTIGSGFAMVWVAVAVMHYLLSDFAVTDQRVIARVGFLRPVVFEVDREAVREVMVWQGSLGRTLGFGSIGLRMADGATHWVHTMANPHEIDRRLRRSGP